MESSVLKVGNLYYKRTTDDGEVFTTNKSGVYVFHDVENIRALQALATEFDGFFEDAQVVTTSIQSSDRTIQDISIWLRRNMPSILLSNYGSQVLAQFMAWQKDNYLGADVTSWMLNIPSRLTISAFHGASGAPTDIVLAFVISAQSELSHEQQEAWDTISTGVRLVGNRRAFVAGGAVDFGADRLPPKRKPNRIISTMSL